MQVQTRQGPAYGVARLSLAGGEQVRVESGAMMAMSAGRIPGPTPSPPPPGVVVTYFVPPSLPAPSTAWAAAKRAMGTRNGEHDT